MVGPWGARERTGGARSRQGLPQAPLAPEQRSKDAGFRVEV